MRYPCVLISALILTPRAERTQVSVLRWRSPELNPVENIWQFMRDNWVPNRIFASYDQIVDLCSEAWIKLINQPWKIISIANRTGGYEF